MRLLSVGIAVTPSKEQLEAKARHFANSVFVIVSGVLMLFASLLQPYAVTLMGESVGGQGSFILATVLIFWLASKRSGLALYATERQCDKYGHVVREGTPTCGRCFQSIPGSAP